MYTIQYYVAKWPVESLISANTVIHIDRKLQYCSCVCPYLQSACCSSVKMLSFNPFPSPSHTVQGGKGRGEEIGKAEGASL
jgi:hypothetical protein